MLKALCVFLGLCAEIVVNAPSPEAHPTLALPPRFIREYRDIIKQEVRLYWGLEPPSTFMAQAYQESKFDCEARSPVGALGCSQFMPATAKWIHALYPKDLGACQSPAGCPTNPQWAFRAQVLYDKRIWRRYPDAEGDERRAFMLMGYNAGPGWVNRERREATARGLDSSRWFDSVETVCLRAASSCRESGGYVRNILLKWRHHF